jgi:predicted LPLAT superfamily acyltransferase
MLLLDELRDLDHLEEERALCDEEKMRKALLLVTWVHSYGGRNRGRCGLERVTNALHFFTQVANSNRRNNSIEYLMVNGTIFTDHSKISEHIVQFYDSLYTKQFSWRPNWMAFLLISL